MRTVIKLAAGFTSLTLAVPAFAGSVPAGGTGATAAQTTTEPQAIVCATSSGTQASNANFSVPDFQVIVSPTDPGPRTISHAGATLKVKPSAVRLPVGIGITPLNARDLPPLDPGMTNVTAKPRAGYRFTPHPMQFAEMIEVSVPYDPALITEDFTAQDIYTYFYDETGSCWRPLYRVRVDEVQHLVVSLTDHFTDMINATVTVPEHPEGVNFDPNEMKGIQAADPGSKVNLIDPPGGNNQGDARLKYPFEIPQGRQGLEPELAVAYDSSKGNGWMGVGWDLASPMITIETRWGVPRYETGTETETYLLNGEQLTPVAHRTAPPARTAEKVFHTRTEGGFAKIVRHGNAPTNYTWEVVDRAGTRWLYGATAEGRLADAGGNVFGWMLQEVRDTTDNFMRYSYARVDDAATQGGQEPGRNLYLKRISYTGSGTTEGKYTVTFTRDRELGEPLRPDKLIDARGGFKKTTTDRLRKVEVALDNSPIRRYEFAYVTGAFHKTLLKSISQFDANGTLFNTHTFDYFDDIRDATGQYQAFNPLPWTSPGDSLSKDALNLTGEQAGRASAINANTSSGGGGHLYVGVGEEPSKSNSIGLKAGFSHNDEDGLLALVDVDGDTLPDKVFRGGNGVFYRKNLSGPHGQPRFDATPRQLLLPGILDESSNSVTLGIESYFGIAAQLDYVNTTTTTSQYFSDVNGDAIMDLVTGSSVLFGRLGPNGVPVYGISGDTPVPIGAGAVDPNGLFGDFAADRERLTDSFPLLDTVRRWVAPYDGTVRVEGPVRLTTPSAAGDGVRVAIQHENTELFSQQIGGQDTTAYTPTGVASIPVTRGQRLYFRVQSIFDGANDVVSWDPIVTYLSQPSTLDVNGLDAYRYQASRDFTLGGRSPSVKLPLTGTVRFSGNLTKLTPTSDDVTVLITIDGDPTPVFQQTLGGASAGTATINFDRAVTQGQVLRLRVVADSPIDLAQIRWAPRLHYTAANGVDRLFDDQGNPFIAFSPPYVVDMYPVDGLTAPQGFHPITSTGTISVDPSLTFNFEGRPVDGLVTFTVKKRGALLAKRFFTIEDGVVSSPGAFSVPVTDGDNLFFDFSTLDPALRGYLTSQSVTVDGAGVPSAFHNAAVEDAFAQPYRGWGAIGYNGNRARAGAPIVQADLVIDDNFGDQIPDSVDPQAQKDAFAADPRINPPKATAFLPFPQHDRWGASDNSWVTRDAASSSRMGTQSINLPRTSDLSGTAVPRLSRSEQISLTGGVGTPVGSLGGSIATGTSTGQVDFLDLNGDQFPDAAGASGIQYSDMVGGLGGKRGTMPDGAVRKSTNIAGNASAGSAARTITTGRGYGAPTGHIPGNTAEGGNDMPPLGVGGNIGSSSSDGEFDLLDTNGDGLPDRVYADGRVALNLGYRFGAREEWRNAGAINDGGGDNFGVNIGFNTDFYGFAGGASYSEASSGSSTSLMDMNGDGLLDRVFAGSPIMVGLNTGSGFEPPVPFFGSLSAISGDQNAKLGGGVYFTIPICFLVICIIINPGGDLSTGASRSEFAIRDINGDGYADHLASSRDNELTVAASRHERTNLLRSVARPLGARIDLDYTRDGNDYGQPHSRWTLSRVSVHDGHTGDGADVQLTTYEYANGVYDRLEREFYGYGKVTERHRDAGNGDAVYRSVVREYLTDSHYTQGLLRMETSLDGAGRPFLQTQHAYQLAEVGAGIADPKSTTATVFPQLVRTDRRFFEGQANPVKTTFITMDYDEYGNVVRSFDAADDGAADDTDTRVGYSASDPACVARNIVGIANDIQVSSAGTLMRDRESTVDCTTGDVTQVRAKLANGDVAATDLQYFGNGNLRAVIGPPNRIGQRDRLDYTYDTTVGIYVESITDSFGFRSTASYNLKFGLVEITTDYNSKQVRNTYDALGRLDKVAGPYEIADNTVTIDFEYHPEATVPYAVTRHVDREASGAVRADTLDTIIFIDGLKRAVQTKKDSSLHNGVDNPTTASMVVSGRVVYDFVGRPVKQYYPRDEAKGAGNVVFNPGFDPVQPAVTTFDILDRPIHNLMPDNTTMTNTHGFGQDRSGAVRFEQVSTDPQGKQKRVYRDVRELITSVKEFNPAGGQPVIWTSYTHDPLRQTVAVTDDRNNVTRSTYDNFGRRTVVESPDAGRIQTDYDLSDNQIRKITSKLAAQGLAVEYDYQFKRLAGIRYPIFTGNNVTYTYGAPGAPNGGANRIIAITDGAGTVAREYGPLGEVTKETRTTQVQGHQVKTFTTQYRYDTWNRMLSMTYPDGEVLTYHYDSGGLVDSATGTKGEFTYRYLQRMDYDKFGQRALLDTGNGTRTVYSYDPADRRLSNLQAKLSNGYVFQNLRYQYDDAGNVTSIQNDTVAPDGPDVGMQVGGPSLQTFRYDDLYRLTHAEGTYSPRTPRVDRYRYDLTYDTIHNITRKTQVHEMVSGGNTIVQGKTSYDYNYAYASGKPHAPTTIGLYTLAYDENGNQISREQQPRPRRQMIWDEENRLACSHENVQSHTLPQTPASCDNAGGTPNNARYYYDDQGERVVKDDAQFHLYPNRSFSTRGNQEFKHVYIGDSKLITKLVEPVQRIEDRQYYSHPDHLGSTGFVTNDRGGMSEHLNYFPGGETWVSEHPSQPVPQQFTGKEFDQQTNLYYFGARYYDPRTQVWQTPDPALESYMDGSPNGGVFHPANLSLYAYAYNNPIRLVDPTGMSTWNRVWGGVKLVGGVVEMAAGVAAGAATSWTGVGAVAGGAVAVHGFDVALSGARQLWSGEHTSSFTSQGLQAAGVSQNTADLIDGGISIVGTMGAGALARAGAATGEQVVNQTLQQTAKSGPPAHLAAGKAAEQAHIASKGLAPNTEGVWRPTLEQMQSAAFKVIVGEGKFTAGGLPTGVKLDALATEIKHGSSALNSSYQLRLMVYRAVTRGEQLVLETQRPLNPTFRAWLERWGVQINQIP